MRFFKISFEELLGLKAVYKFKDFITIILSTHGLEDRLSTKIDHP